jgi:hypothetical protein
VNIFLSCGKTFAITILFSRAYPTLKEIERDYLTTTFFHLDLLLYHMLKVKVGEIPFVVYQNKVLKPELLKTSSAGIIFLINSCSP